MCHQILRKQRKTEIIFKNVKIIKCESVFEQEANRTSRKKHITQWVGLNLISYKEKLRGWKISLKRSRDVKYLKS